MFSFKRFIVRLLEYRIVLLVSLLIVAVLLLTLWAAWAAGNKTLFDVIEILIIPAVLGVGALLFNRATQSAERRSTLDRQRQETLTTYFDRMSDLLLRRKLRDATKGSEVRTVAQARTVSALRSLDGQRIAQLIQFLTKSNLGGNTLLTIDLSEADLQRINLAGANLQMAILIRADLQRTRLQTANLREAILLYANLQRANLNGINLQKAILTYANLQRTSLAGANLKESTLTYANLQRACLNTAKLQRANLRETKLQRAHLWQADLRQADLGKANLQRAHLWEANLERANLVGTNLAKANLIHAYISLEQLSAIESLQGATMPNGMKYEDWVAKGKPDWTKGTDDK